MRKIMFLSKNIKYYKQDFITLKSEKNSYFYEWEDRGHGRKEVYSSRVFDKLAREGDGLNLT